MTELIFLALLVAAVGTVTLCMVLATVVAAVLPHASWGQTVHERAKR